MQAYYNIYKDCITFVYQFDNGWSAFVHAMYNGNEISIFPTWIVEATRSAENRERFNELISDTQWNDSAMRKRGDLFSNVKSDDRIAVIISSVKKRSQEKHLSDIEHQIMMAGK